jgi:hemerythrin
MPHLEWTNDLNIGVSVIDKQHHRIVEYINELYDAQSTKHPEEVIHVLDELVDYTLTHFAFEEDLQFRSQYPFVKAHKRVHEIFTKRISQFQERAKAGENVIPELLTMLKIWLVNHIKGDDLDYVESVQSHLGDDFTTEQKSSWLNTSLKKFFG